MTKPEVIKMLGILSVAYPNMKEITELTVDVWYDFLKGLPAKVCYKAVKMKILESPYPPTISDIYQRAMELINPVGKDKTEAWGEVIRAISYHGYMHESDALESMSPETAVVVKAMGWQMICRSENIDVVRGQFLKMYESIEARRKHTYLLHYISPQGIKGAERTGYIEEGK